MMGGDFLVSVIIPTYRRPEMLHRAVQSVLEQTYSHIEILVVDDNNPDTEERVLTEIAMSSYSSDARVKYIKHDSNRNGSAARNTGWKASNGEFITFLDDDDVIAPEKIERQVDCLSGLDQSWGACYTGYHTLMEDGTIQKSTNKESGDVYIRALMRTFYVGSGSNLMLRRSVVDSIGGFDESFLRNQDIEFMARAFEKCKVAYIDEDLLTIHWEVRSTKRDFEFVDNVTTYYLDKMSKRISLLSKSDQHRVRSVIALDRARVAYYYKNHFAAVRILKDSGVRINEVFQYFFYLAHRVITKKSYGFYLK